MSQGSDAADQMVKETIAVTEMAVKLAGSGAKNLIVLLTLYAKENHQLKGETNLKKLIKEGKELRIVYLDNDDLAEFKNYAKEYGILYSALKYKDDGSPTTDILVKAEDIPRVNRILEKMNYPLPSERENEKKEESNAKKSPSAVQSEKASSELQTGSNMPMKESDGRRSVKERINELEMLKSQAQEKYKIKSITKER